MTAFGLATDSAFEDPNHGLDALFRPAGVGGGTAARVILRSPDGFVGFGERRYVVETVVVMVRVSEVETPCEGDTFDVGGVVYEVMGAPQRDSLRLVWTCEARRS